MYIIYIYTDICIYTAYLLYLCVCVFHFSRSSEFHPWFQSWRSSIRGIWYPTVGHLPWIQSCPHRHWDSLPGQQPHQTTSRDVGKWEEIFATELHRIEKKCRKIFGRQKAWCDILPREHQPNHQALVSDASWKSCFNCNHQLNTILYLLNVYFVILADIVSYLGPPLLTTNTGTWRCIPDMVLRVLGRLGSIWPSNEYDPK